MKILITGGMGFIGKAVTHRLLDEGVERIVLFDNLLEKIHGHNPIPHDFKDRRVSFVKGDTSIRSEIEPWVTSADVILHLAAETGTGQSMYDIENYSRVNISSVSLLLDILSNSKHAVKKVVLASSRAVYGEGQYYCPNHSTIYPSPRQLEDLEKGEFEIKCPTCRAIAQVMATHEDASIHPISFYGISKQFQEAMVSTLCPNLGISPVILRYQNVYGPGQSLSNPYTGILSIFSNLICQGLGIEVFEDGKESRDFVFISDVAEATVREMLDDRANGQILNIGSGLPVDLYTIAQTLGRLFQKDINISINGKFRLGDIRHNYANIGRLKQLLGFFPLVTLEQGLPLFVEWVLKQQTRNDQLGAAMAEMAQRGLYKQSHRANSHSEE